jgi:four helix bundle protein
MNTHENLTVWNKSIDYVTELYRITHDFPASEKYSLVDQMRRSGVSVPSNIAEGAARGSQKEFKRFLHISLGSAAELQTQLMIARNLNFLSDQEFQVLLKQSKDISKMISGLIRSLGV